MSIDITPQEAIRRLEEHFGSREGMLTQNLIMLSMSGQPADVTFYRRRPIINVRVGTKLGAAQLYGLEGNLSRLLKRIELSNGAIVSIDDIWTVNPMPRDGFSQAELDAVDLSEGDQQAGPNGETVRKMIKGTYHCRTKSEVDYYLRRWIAS